MGIVAVILRTDICPVLSFLSLLESPWNTYRKIIDHSFGSREYPPLSMARDQPCNSIPSVKPGKCCALPLAWSLQNSAAALSSELQTLNLLLLLLISVQFRYKPDKTRQPQFCQMRENSINAWDRRANKFWTRGWTGMLLQFCDSQTGHKTHTNVSVRNSKNIKYCLGQPPGTKF